MKKAIRLFLTKKSVEAGFQDFHHYCDCEHEDKMDYHIPEWIEEFIATKLNGEK